ncbi:carbonic anhydrase 2-like [Drosophila innubila]|uniref:carbonic anhydrase 2-like n=1 Tax=Drosophila innubila TaxID=198719 RepID=UPI00148C3661|nr:carbonic anhydrase 2-like [Drosophila innubila]
MWNLRLQSAIIFACVLIVSGNDFGYDGQQGPQHWADDYKRCSGKHQSPINIDKLHVAEISYPEIKYFNFDAKPKAVHMKNNGHTVLVTMSFEPGKEPRVSGGPLNTSNGKDFQFEQFHFHWGENDTVGSEDMINNHRYPAEMHVVMRNLDYIDFQSALGQELGIAVLAFFFKVNKKLHNPHYGEFVEMLSLIDRKGSSTELELPLPLMKFLSASSMNYYTYVGSLTTPPCAERIIWIDYQDPIDLSEYQLNLFRKLTANNEHMRNNFRPIQPLNDRVIYKNLVNDDMIEKSWISPHNGAGFTDTGSGAILLGCSLVMLLRGNIFAAFN